MPKLAPKNIVVFGINSDSVEQHRRFAADESLNFHLLSDAGGKTAEAYGVQGPNGAPLRVTFIVGPDGQIHAIDGGVDRQFARENGKLVSHHGENLALLLSDWRARVGSQVPNFFLPNYDGKTVCPLPPSEVSGPGAPRRKATVVLLLGAACPYSRALAPAVGEMAASPVYKDVAFLAVLTGTGDASAADAAGTGEELAKAGGLSFPVASDLYREVTGHLEATATPSVWVLDARGGVVYRGAIQGDRGERYLKEALDATLSGRPVPVPETKAKGTPVAPSKERRRRSAYSAPRCIFSPASTAYSERLIK